MFLKILQNTFVLFSEAMGRIFFPMGSTVLQIERSGGFTVLWYQ